ncbi:non-structural maintenance of chromosomes element 4 homolog A-like [Mercurialis annua]|uniref:non-structural maintenance of chromosomes element 4 homolog A-like n=1 Tax=Mercurialis annua TaxID=3986 RepID=UPI00215FFC1A|nr:non-structural maintenance of chromosomes element 4 homolog A-like [Mercurialis annua]
MVRAVKREPPPSNGVEEETARELRAVKRERLTRKVRGGGGPHQQEEAGENRTETPTDTPADPRLLRSKYHALFNKINDERDDLTKTDSDKFASIFKEVEDLHKHVQRPREQVADAEALLGIASSLGTSVKSQHNEGITAADFVSGLLAGFGQSNRTLGSQENSSNVPTSINWKHIGLVVSPIFMKCNGFSTMIGPMKTEFKQRKAAVPRTKRVRPTEKSRPEEIEETEAEKKTDTDNNMSTMFEILRRNKRVRLENLILNRRSFAQTVENLFALSFLVKDGRVEISVDGSGHHFVSPRNAPAASSVMSGEVAYRHFVFRFDFRDWKVMTDVVQDGNELMPDRKSVVSESEREASVHQGNVNRTPIRKLSRHRGLVLQEDSIVEDSPDIGAAKGVGSLRCKRKLN